MIHLKFSKQAIDDILTLVSNSYSETEGEKGQEIKLSDHTCHVIYVSFTYQLPPLHYLETVRRSLKLRKETVQSLPSLTIPKPSIDNS